MGTIFEELVRRFNEENNEEAGEHWTPRDAVKLMARLVLLPVADRIESGTYLLYDGACGTGGMQPESELRDTETVPLAEPGASRRSSGARCCRRLAKEIRHADARIDAHSGLPTRRALPSPR
jgi:hypothetical protein